jgi:tetratricopeptide (TPR) repeat protein
MRANKKRPRGDSPPRPTTPEKAAPAEYRPESVGATPRRFWLAAGLAAVAIFSAYANHFHNSFHFDDAHTVVNNIYIRNLHNIPRFFTDATTFSSLPANQTWRPIVSLSLALDYKLGHGATPLWFHISTFFWFLVQLWLMYLLYTYIMNVAEPREANRYIALFAVLWYALHPAIAETVNYIIQRADLYATLGVVAGMVIYIRFPGMRKFGIYLLPVILGAMSKATAVVFGGIVLIYVFLFEEDGNWNRWWPAIVKSLPALVVSVILAEMNIHLTSKTYLPSVTPSAMYWATQPYVLMKYVRSLFLPLWLSADTDLNAFTGFSDPLAIGGLLFCAALLGVGFWAIKRREHRPIAFGIFWYFGASAPTSLFVLSEVENDHRMFFPFVGLMLSVTWAAALGIYRWIEKSPQKRASIIRGVQIVSALILVAYALGTWQRNKVWRNEEALFYDVTIKSPENGRGLMNYGLTQMEKGDINRALDYFARAASFTPRYPILEVNTGIAYGVLNQNAEAEKHFRRAVELSPEDAQTHFFYGRWLWGQGRATEAIAELKSSIEKNPPWMDPRSLLMDIYFRQGEGPELKLLAQDTLQIAPGDAAVLRYLAASQSMRDPVSAAEYRVKTEPSADNYLNLSLVYHQAKRYQDSIDAARKAIQLQPNFPEAYNNIAADYEDMHQWDLAIEAAKKALQLRPDFQLAKNNLAWSESQKKLKAH